MLSLPSLESCHAYEGYFSFFDFHAKRKIKGGQNSLLRPQAKKKSYSNAERKWFGQYLRLIIMCEKITRFNSMGSMLENGVSSTLIRKLRKDLIHLLLYD